MTQSGRPSVSDSLDVAGERIRTIVERIEHIEEEIKALNEGKKEIFQEAKGEGYDVKVIKEIIRLRKQDKDERDEHETLLDVYLRAMESSEPEQSKAA
ncbi:hypothetical protein CCR94_00390 [Rhodoblastus sphagnicola]|uniref:GapR-like DNA-binding domain-containing protein n=1 Tax=Rhodoblastus sphagnicola TaxID=333368 RepID=A0A2S6NH47_9HYPH|nr:hypothetical protein CCR94_00390 [Rhodoblastus sphagnicola]